MEVQRLSGFGGCGHLQRPRTEPSTKAHADHRLRRKTLAVLRTKSPYFRRSSHCIVQALLKREECIFRGFGARFQHRKGIEAKVVGYRGVIPGAWKRQCSAAGVPRDKEALISGEADALEDAEPPGALGWVRKKWAENRAEYHRLRKILKDLGLAGFLSYGLFNTAYYLVSFLFVWFFVAPSPSGLGVGAAAQRFLKIFAMVWAGSQVTKLLRAGGALLLAPLVDRGLDWFTAKGKFRSKAQAFWAIVGSCVVLALVVFVVIVSLWA